MHRRFRTAALVSFAALALAACEDAPPTPVLEGEQGVAQPLLSGDAPIVAEFERVSRDAGVPLEVLVGVAWVESRFSTQPPEPSAFGGHGLMQLAEGHTLERAAALTGADATALKTDPVANLEGAAAVLAALHAETGSWDAAVWAYGPGDLDARAGEVYLDKVHAAIERGADGVDSDGYSIRFRGLGGQGAFVTGEFAATPDYSGARWEGPVCSGNYTNASRGPGDIDEIVIHTCQGGWSGCWGWLKNCDSGVSAHYVISSTGEIVQIVEEQDIGYHDGCNNTTTIGIEHEGFVDDPDRWYTDEMYCESAKLTRSICDRYGIPCDREHVLGHGETDDCSTHTDPGPGWNWTKYMDWVECGCGGCGNPTSPEVCNGMDDDGDGRVDNGDVCEIEFLNAQAHAYAQPSTTDVDGDGAADVCGRGISGVWCHFARDGAWAAKTETRPGWSDGTGWDAADKYATIRMGDVNGDARADVCGRGPDGVYCQLGSPTGLDLGGEARWLDGLGDAGGWDRPAHYTTIRLADVDGDGSEDLCARTPDGFRCWTSTGNAFAAAGAIAGMSDADGWAAAKHYGTIRMGDIDGDGRLDVCGRGPAGVSCWTSDGAGWTGPVAGPQWSDTLGWDGVDKWSTIRLVDVNGDGMDDLCGRNTSFLECALANGDGFAFPSRAADWGDGAGWTAEARYGSIRTGDIDGNGTQDLCALDGTGVVCAAMVDGEFQAVTGPAWADAGWGDGSYWHTFTLADVNGDRMDDACGRSATGWTCALSTGTGFGDVWTLDEFTDAGGWNADQYWQTLVSAGPLCRARPETCNQVDDDCDGEVDEDGACDPTTGDMTGGDATAGTDGGVLADGATIPTGGDAAGGDTAAGADVGPQGDGGSKDGCGCRTIGGESDAPMPLGAAAAMFLGGLLFWRRTR